MVQGNDFNFPVVRNGMDYLVSVREHLSSATEPRAMKYAILHLHAATEVLLKLPLIHYDWKLVVQPDEEGRICHYSEFQ